MKTKRRWISLCLVLVLILSAMPVGVQAEEAVKEDNTFVFSTGYEESDIHVATPAYVTQGLRTDVGGTDVDSIAAYSSVTAGRVGAVKDQGNYGCCWAMAATTCAEATYYANEKENKSLLSIPTFSAMQLAGFAYQTSADPLGNASSDTIALSSARSGILEFGGNNYKTMFSVAAWDTATLEKNLPFTEESANKIIDQAAGNETSYEAVARIKDVHLLDFTESSTTLAKKISAIKGLVYEYGAVTGSFYVAQTNTFSYLNKNNGSYYYPNSSGTNHMITIVGWNDDYPAANFVQDPGKNGAWLIQNSWGAESYTTDGDADPTNSGAEGYMWISYYDQSLGTNYGAFDYQSADRYQNNYMYDGGIGLNYVYGISYDIGATYTVKASSRERLEAVSFMTLSSDVKGTVTIRKNTVQDNPMSGTDVVTGQEFEFTYPGFHTIDLDTKYIFNKGETYTIIFSFDDEVAIWVDQYYTFNDYISQVSTANDKTYIIYGTDYLPQYNRTQEFTSSYTLRLKGYTNNVYTVSYAKNSDDTNVTDLPAAQDKINKQTLVLSESIPTREGYAFVGWSLTENSVEADYAAGDKFDLDRDTTLYPVWDTDDAAYYTVQTQSRVLGTDDSLTNVSGGKRASENLGTTLKAEDAPAGYTFKGWYKNYSSAAETLDDSDRISEEQTVSYKPTADIVLTAVYSPDPAAAVELTVTASAFDYTTTAGAIAQGTVSYYMGYKPGQSITVTYTDTADTFLCWEDVNGNIVSTDPTYTFKILKDTKLNAVTADSAGYDAAALVVFTDADGTVISAKRFTVAKKITFPTLPTGATAWSMTSAKIHAAMYDNRIIFVKAQ